MAQGEELDGWAGGGPEAVARRRAASIWPLIMAMLQQPKASFGGSLLMQTAVVAGIRRLGDFNCFQGVPLPLSLPPEPFSQGEKQKPWPQLWQPFYPFFVNKLNAFFVFAFFL